MNRFKKFTSLFDREKLNLYKRFLRKSPSESVADPSKSSPDQKAASDLKSSESEAKKVKDPPLETPIEITPKASPKRKFLINSGPHLYVSQVLNTKGPLTAKEIWVEYLKDDQAVDKQLLRSKTFLQKRVIPSMLEKGKVAKAGWSPVAQKYMGYSLVPERAFRRTDPEVLVGLQPRPQIKRMKKIENMEINKKEEKKD